MVDNVLLDKRPCAFYIVLSLLIGEPNGTVAHNIIPTGPQTNIRYNMTHLFFTQDNKHVLDRQTQRATNPREPECLSDEQTARLDCLWEKSRSLSFELDATEMHILSAIPERTTEKTHTNA
jgi:hypothetical protein